MNVTARRTFQRTGARRALQVTLAALSVIPAVTGVAGLLAGSAVLPTVTEPVNATLDSQYRFVSAAWLASAPVLWAVIPDVEHRGTAVRGLVAVLFGGGLARLLSWRRVGRPHAVLAVANALELIGSPVILVWQSRVARNHGGRG